MLPFLPPLCIAASLVGFAPIPSQADPSQPMRPGPKSLRSHAPEGTLIWIESSALEPILGQGLSHPLIARLLEEPLIAEDWKAKKFDPMAGLRLAEALLGRNPFELAHALASGGIALGFLGVTPGKEAPFVMLRGLDGEAMESAVEDLTGALSGLGLLAEVDARESEGRSPSIRQAWQAPKSDGVVVWTSDGTLILTRTWKDAITCSGLSARSSAIPEAYRQHFESTSIAETFAWFDLDALESQVGLKDLRAMATEPGVHFVLGPALAYLGRAGSLSMDLDVSSEALRLRMRGDGVDAGEGAGSFPASDSIAKESSAPKDAVATAMLHRDLHFLLDRRTDLFPPRQQPGIAEGLSNLALLVGGPDALDELLSSLHPTLRLHSETIAFAENAEPDVPLPGLILEVDLDEPDINGSRLTSAFQTAVTLTNVERAMKGEDGLRLGLESVDGVTVTRAKLQPPAPGSSVDLRYNLEPACAVVGRTFLVGTHGAPIAKAVQRLSGGSTSQAAMPTRSDDWIPVDRLQLQGVPLHGLLTQQRDLIVMNSVLEDGKSQRRAEAEADILLELLGRVQRFEFHSDWLPEPRSKRTIRAGLTVHLLR
ncbi:hypothetical protein Poly30_08380 [Planctomycetes bacterium Poly30]|uniref:DUF3352 domain-containing protein n=1 Tax=Saltatorellus ferox TaxID=2528018 RepID=A0A518EMQ2_9BACT|nr:hypothetical protein Poly30_08380 [Planctomycetes bacterium Poly30]